VLVRLLFSFFLSLILFGCSEQLTFVPGGMGDPKTTDISLIDSSYIVSKRHGIDISKPVIMVVHGYTASTFEWSEFSDYADGRGDTPLKGVYVSSVLLGGHGRSLDSFRKTSWKDWSEPIISEYNALVSLGFRSINIVGASTGGTLILDLLAEEAFSQSLNSVVFVDSLVHPRSKLLALVPYIYPFVKDIRNEAASDEKKKYWYTINPKEGMRELAVLIKLIQNKLEIGIVLPAKTVCQIFQASNDPVVDPQSAISIYDGIRLHDGSKPVVSMLESDLHVFTRLRARDKEAVTQFDKSLQHNVFEQIITLAKQ
jgi:carboxylesterase